MKKPKNKVSLTQAFKTLSWYDHVVGVLLMVLAAVISSTISEASFSNTLFSIVLAALCWFGGATLARRKVMQENGGKWIQ